MTRITFTGWHQPQNFKKIDNFVMRSAQPKSEEIIWLKKNEGLTDIINFRTLVVPKTDFNEEELADALYIKYHSIPTTSKSPKLEDAKSFLNLIDEIKQRNGKALIHCRAGADRTGMYSFIYEVINKLATPKQAADEMIEMGHNRKLYPDMIEKAIGFIKKINKNI